MLSLLGLALAVPGTASASPQSPAQQAAALRSQVNALTLKVSQATEAYDTAESQLGDLVTRSIAAQQTVDQLSGQTSNDRATQTDRVRALYMTGGSAGLLNSVLDGDVTDAAARLKNVQAVMSADQTRTQTSEQQTAQAQTAASRLKDLATQKTALQQAAAAQAAAIQAALAQQKTLLARANAQVKALAAQQQAAAAAKAAAQFAAQLAAAKGTSGVGSNPSTANLPAGSPPTAQAAAAIAAARTRLGDPYVWGATGPDTFDCSGLTGWAYRQAGITLPRTSREQWFSGPHETLAQLAPGDLLFWATDTSNPASIHHVALYIGAGMMIAAPDTGDVVKIQAVYLDGYIGAVRPVS